MVTATVAACGQLYVKLLAYVDHITSDKNTSSLIIIRCAFIKRMSIATRPTVPIQYYLILRSTECYMIGYFPMRQAATSRADSRLTPLPYPRQCPLVAGDTTTRCRSDNENVYVEDQGRVLTATLLPSVARQHSSQRSGSLGACL